MSDATSSLREFYQRELAYLRRAGSHFARQHPKIAARLEMGLEEAADPFTERLVESFAFLTARVQRNIENELPRLADTLLSAIYPSLNSPLPSMAVAQLQPDPEKCDLKSGLHIPAGSRLFCDSRSSDAHVTTIRWSTGYPVTLWPVRIEDAEMLAGERAGQLQAAFRKQGRASSVVRIRLAGQGAPLHSMDFESLRFHIPGERSVSFALFEMLLGRCTDIFLANGDAMDDGLGSQHDVVCLPPDSLRPVGMERADRILPAGPGEHPAYGLLREYFAFPEKHLFFDIDNLDRRGPWKSMDICLVLDAEADQRIPVGADSFCLGAVPVVNIFERVTDPIRLDETRLEYRLVVDARREESNEVHTVLEVKGVDPDLPDAIVYKPFFSYDHAMFEQGQKALWIARRSQAPGDLPGTDTLLRFVDLGFDPARPPVRTVFGRVLCTNRHACLDVQSGTVLQHELDEASLTAHLLDKPTAQSDPPLGGEVLWRLVSQLSLNHLSLDGPEGSRAFREILRLYAPGGSKAAARSISAVHNMRTSRCVARFGPDHWRGFCRGQEVELELDKEHFAGGSPYIFASVLSRFLGLYATINSFTRLSVRLRGENEVWKQWPPMAGDQILL